MASSESGTCSEIPTTSTSGSEVSSGESVEMEAKVDLASPNQECSSDCDKGQKRSTVTQSVVQPASDNHPPISKHRYDRTKVILIWVALVAIFVISTVLFSLLINCALFGYWWHQVTVRIDQLERQSNGSASTQPTLDSTGFEDGDWIKLSQRLSRFEEEVRKNITSLREEIGLMRELHANDTEEIKRNTNDLRRQFSTTLNNSLSMLSSETQSAISLLNASVVSQVVALKSHSLMVAMNVSILADSVTALEIRSHDLEHNISLLEESLTAQLDTATREYRTGVSSIAVNVSMIQEEVQDLHLGQVEQRIMTEGIRSNVSALKHDLEQLTEVTTNHTAMLSEIEMDLSRIDTSHRVELERLSDAQEDLHGALNLTREELTTSIATLKDTIAALDSDVAEKLTNLSNIQQNIRDELSAIDENFNGSVTALELFILSLNKSALETNEKLQNITDGQRDLAFELDVTRGALLANVSSVERELREEIAFTHEQLQRNISSLQSQVRLDFTETREIIAVNISVLKDSITRTNMDLNNTSSRLQNLSSLYGDLQVDNLATKESFSTHRATVSQNVSQLFDLIHNVRRNHSSLIDSHSRSLRAVESNISVLTQQLQNVSQLQSSQDRRITSVQTSFNNQLSELRHTLSSEIDDQGRQLGTRIDGHVQLTRRSLNEHLRKLTSLGNRVHQLENGASTVLPLPLLIISIISLLTLYAITFE